MKITLHIISFISWRSVALRENSDWHPVEPKIHTYKNSNLWCTKTCASFGLITSKKILQSFYYQYSHFQKIFKNPYPIFILHLNKYNSHSPKECLVSKLVKICPVVLVKKWKNVKVYRQTDANQKVIRKDHLSIQLKWANKLIFHNP